MPLRAAGRYEAARAWPAWLAIVLLAVPGPVSFASCGGAKPARSIPSVGLRELAAGFDHPVHLTHAGDGSGRLFVVEQAGVIRVIEQGKVISQPFLDIRDRVSSGGEKGLLSVAFHPRFKENGLFYVNYTGREGGVLYTRVSRFGWSSHNRADPASEDILLRIRQPFANHNGGQITFGPDDYLYIGMGDGGLAYDPFGHGQDTATLLGALLRIDVDGRSASLRYGIPSDNPFAGHADARPEIWAYGFRNPWRFSFDPENGRLFVADVGQDRIEEIDVVKKGGNYGWGILEGGLCARLADGVCKHPDMEAPVFSYAHPEGFSITGGHVYRGCSIPALRGVYLYADYVTKRLWGLRYEDKEVTRQRLLVQTPFNISSFGMDQDGELFIVGHQSGKIIKIVPVHPAGPGSP